MIQSEKEENVAEVIEKDGILTVNVSALNFREGPSLTYKVHRVLPRGEQLTSLKEQKTADSYTWTKVVDSKGKIGWIATIYANLD